MISILAQINTGTPFDPLLNAFFVEYGAFPTTVLFIVLLLLFVWKGSQDADSKTQNAVTELSLEQTRKLNKVSEDFRVYQTTSQAEFLKYKNDAEYQRGVLEGRITELGHIIQRGEEKYERQQKEWEAKHQTLTKKHEDNEKRISELQNELRGKSEQIALLEAERDQLRFENNDKSAQIAKLTSQIEALQRDKAELEKQIEELKAPKPLEVVITPAIPVPNDDTLPLDEETLKTVNEPNEGLKAS